MSALKIPPGPEAVTPEWLTAALRSTGLLDRSTGIRSFESTVLGDGKGFTGRVCLFKLAYERPQPELPPSIIAKFPPADPQAHAALHYFRLYEREYGFYHSGAETPGFRVPCCHYGDIELESGASILLLEHLDSAVPFNFVDGLTFAEARGVLKSLASFHAAWWESPRLDNFAWLLPFDHNADSNQEAYEGHFPLFVDKVGGVVPERLVRLGERMLGNLTWVRRQLSRAPVTFVHGDFHPNNLLAEGTDADSGTVVIDWQVCSRGAAERDLMYLLVSSLDSAIRQSATEQLVEFYHQELLSAGVRGYSLQDCRYRYRLALLDQVVFLVTVVTLLDFTVNQEAEDVLEILLDRWGGAVLEQDIEELLPS